MEKTYNRLLAPPAKSFFLFGPRGVGKSFWLMERFPDALRIDLLDPETNRELVANPENLASHVEPRAKDSWIIIDEVQKNPVLLDVVHRLMQKRKWKFALCGSSARKLRLGGANLLAGRAITMSMSSMVSSELGADFDLEFALRYGGLPSVIEDRETSEQTLSAYVGTYIKEEIREEGAVRRLEPFLRFLQIVGMSNGQLLNYSNISREVSVPRSSVENYFSILIDTLLCSTLPAYRAGLKVREQTHPKFYWFDAGVARASAGLLGENPGDDWLGRSLETLILNEMRVYAISRSKWNQFSYYRTGSGVEIDFVVETRKRYGNEKAAIIGIEVKHSKAWNRKWERPLRDLSKTGKIDVQRMIGVYTGEREYKFDGFEVLPVTTFLSKLHGGGIF
ncbi:MAG: DUF4143 domain-containing protein [Planctomycetes bacterium]|nr:DUF4143 domain-containing protein [Planctomycetota bacterium]